MMPRLLRILGLVVLGLGLALSQSARADVCKDDNFYGRDRRNDAKNLQAALGKKSAYPHRVMISTPRRSAIRVTCCCTTTKPGRRIG